MYVLVKLGISFTLAPLLKLQAFLSEASSQLEIQREASKAQSTCVNSEYFEAERLILLAGNHTQQLCTKQNGI